MQALRDHFQINHLIVLEWFCDAQNLNAMKLNAKYLIQNTFKKNQATNSR